MILLRDLLKSVDILAYTGDLNKNISGISFDSRKIKENNCFIAIKGFKNEGLNYLEEAINKGANSIISQNKPYKKNKNITWVQVKNDRKALSQIASRFYNNPSERMNIIGVTGTNGKTTVTSIINAILNKHEKTAKIGTLGMSYEDIFRKIELTTPESPDIFNFLSEVEALGCKNVVIEVSSAALKLNRVDDINFSQCIFTSFSGDHLDFHKSMEDYFESKLKLFRNLTSNNWAIVNIDDSHSFKIIDELNCKYLTYGFSNNADIKPIKYRFSLSGIKAIVQTPKGEIEIESLLIGRVNLSNLLGAISSALISGISFDSIRSAIKDFKPVRGRLDFTYKNNFSVLIDYAHTDNALETLLKSLGEIVSKRVILVFGAGGSRDKTKRSRMGKAASKNADFVVVTSDNPRNEEPKKIIEDIIKGFDKDFVNFQIEVEREKAIRKALSIAEKGDCVVIAGKGHEDYQIFKDRVIHFDDYEIVNKFLREKNYGKI